MSSPETAAMEETLEQMQARHRKEQRDLQSRITNKKKNATKKTRKFVNDECASLERQLKERQEAELKKFMGGGDDDDDDDDDDGDEGEDPNAVDGTASPSEPPINGLADKLQSTTLTSSSSSSSSSTQQQSQQQQPQPPQQKQKRNRQRERLARRAAEAHAAALAAEQEAASMTDHRGRERAALQAAFTARGLREHEIAPDGHCLFSAVADQLAVNGLSVDVGVVREDRREGRGEGGTEGAGAGPGSGSGADRDLVKVPPYRAVRRAAADWILRHRDEYAGFLDEGVDEYVARIRDTAEWGGQLELSALAGAYGVEIRVVQDGRTEVVRPAALGQQQEEEEEEEEKKGGAEGKGKEDEEVKTLWLAYYRHGYGLGEHYNSLRKAE